MDFELMFQAVNDAANTMRRADKLTDWMLRLCVGRLRRANVSGSTLSALKRELKGWDMHRWEWKD